MATINSVPTLALARFYGNRASTDTIYGADTVVCTLTGIFKVWNLFGLLYSSQSDRVSENRSSDAAMDSLQVVTSAFYCQALDAVCVTTHEQNIAFYHRDGLKQFKQVYQARSTKWDATVT